MKKHLLKYLGIFLMALTLVPMLTSCSDDPIWWDDPGGNWNYTDRRLTGYWQLVSYNDDYVPESASNFFSFDGYGNGYYYYYSNGFLERERIHYWCQESYNGASGYQINIQYEYSNPLTTNYWFTHNNNTLWMQWQTAGGRVQTYVYDRINYSPW